MELPAWATQAWARVEPYAERLALWRGYEAELETLAILGIGIAVYTALVFAFYQNLSRRKPFHFRASDRPGWGGRVARFAERALVFPVTSFLYFAVLGIALFVLAKAQGVHQILTISMAVIVGVRVTVYLSEAMSNDLAKLVPLSLLAVVIVDPGYTSLAATWARLAEAWTLWPLLGRYFLLFIALEAVMASARWAILRIDAKWPTLRKSMKTRKATFSVEVKGSTGSPEAKPNAEQGR